MKKLLVLLSFAMMATAGTAWGASQHVTMRLVSAGGVGDIIGMIEFKDTAKGLKIIPNLRGLTEGQHGTHVHQNPECGPAEKDGNMVPGLAAGGHFDPNNTERHEGSQGQGHLGVDREQERHYRSGPTGGGRTLRGPDGALRP